MASLCVAETVSLTNASNKIILADYMQGTNNASPVLLLHSFMQTKDFPTVSRLASALHDSGHTVLNPTLSLGISNRKESLLCEAIHTHSLDSDTEEIRQWINWLHNKTNKAVTLIGHSSGGPVILRYMEKHNAEFVHQAILISMAYYGAGPVANETRELAEIATRAINQNNDTLGNYALRYCNSYQTYASAYLSYYNWNLEKTISVVSKFNNKVAIIIGSADKRFDNSWLKRPDAKYNRVITIEGAGHFFDHQYEFDLLDAVEKLLNNSPDW